MTLSLHTPNGWPGVCLCALLCAQLGACVGEQTASHPPIEVVTHRAWHETLQAVGEINSAAKTLAKVPGTGWETRRLVSMVPDGSVVKKGQVIARFDAPQARAELSVAEAELLRKEISEQGIAATLEIKHAELAADRAKVAADLRLTEHYTKAELTLHEKSKVLEGLIDAGFLRHKNQYLNWQTRQIGARTDAERALLKSQKETVLVTANQKRKSLAELDLVAPHDGVFFLVRRWDGSRPTLGATLWADEDFGSLPDLNTLLVRFKVAQADMYGLKPGLPIHARLAGTGTAMDLVISSVGSNAQPKSNESPVKYSEFEALLDHNLVVRLGLKPGQAMFASVQLVSKANALTVPNVALVQEGTAFYVYTYDGRHNSAGTKQKVELGLRGPIRSEVKSGLAAGTKIHIIPPTGEAK